MESSKSLNERITEALEWEIKTDPEASAIAIASRVAKSRENRDLIQNWAAARMTAMARRSQRAYRRDAFAGFRFSFFDEPVEIRLRTRSLPEAKANADQILRYANALLKAHRRKSMTRVKEAIPPNIQKFFDMAHVIATAPIAHGVKRNTLTYGDAEKAHAEAAKVAGLTPAQVWEKIRERAGKLAIAAGRA